MPLCSLIGAHGSRTCLEECFWVQPTLGNAVPISGPQLVDLSEKWDNNSTHLVGLLETFGKTYVKSSNTLATSCEGLTHWKRPWCWERVRTGGEGDDRGRDGWMASLTQWPWVWATSGDGEGQGSLVCCSPRGHKEWDMTERLNNSNKCREHSVWSLTLGECSKKDRTVKKALVSLLGLKTCLYPLLPGIRADF